MLHNLISLMYVGYVSFVFTFIPWCFPKPNQVVFMPEPNRVVFGNIRLSVHVYAVCFKEWLHNTEETELEVTLREAGQYIKEEKKTQDKQTKEKGT